MLNKSMTKLANDFALKSHVKDEPAFVTGFDKCVNYLIPDLQKKLMKHSEKDLKALKNHDISPMTPEAKLQAEIRVAVCREIYSMIGKLNEPEHEENEE